MGKNNNNCSDAYNQICLSYREKYQEKEEWKPIIYKGITSKYLISNYGRIFDREKIKIPSVSLEKNHYRVNLNLDNKTRLRIGTYRLVALMFIPIPQKYLDAGYTVDELVVDHKRDGDEDNLEDNTIWNLQWLTHRENISKAANCGYRAAYPKEFRNELDEMILDDCGNKEIYEYFKNKYGYEKEEIKAQIQVRRRRLGKTLKEHHENDKEFTAKIDKLLKQGLSNEEIIKKLNMPTEGRSSGRLLQYRRSLLNIPANASDYLDNEQNEKLKELIAKGYSTNEIINYFKLNNLPPEVLKKFRATVGSRRSQYKKNVLGLEPRKPILDKDQSAIAKNMLLKGYKNKEIISYLKLDNLPEETLKRLNATINTQRCKLKEKMQVQRLSNDQ